MRLHRALLSLRHRPSPAARPRRSPLRRIGHVEQLETRRLLTITVDDPGDVTDPNDGKTTLREAVEEANMAGADETIVFTCQVPTVSLNQGEINVGSSGHDITIDGMLDCPDEGQMVTVTADNQFRVFNVDDGDATYQNAGVIFKNLTITGGAALEGGAIRNVERTTLHGVVVTGNMASSGVPATPSYGGGIANVNGRLDVIASTVSNNLTTSPQPDEQTSFGGGIGSRGSASHIVVRDSFISDNTVLGSGGGLFQRGGKLEVTNSSVWFNTAGGVLDADHRGGGLALLGGGPGGASPLDVRLTDAVVSGNILTNNSDRYDTLPYGGGLYASGSGMVTISGGAFSTNEVGGVSLANQSVRANGGAAFFSANSISGDPLTVVVQNANVRTNTAGSEGGGFVARARNNSLLDLDISFTTFRANSAATSGGALIASAPSSTLPARIDLFVADSQFENNFAGEGTLVTGMAGKVVVERSTIDRNTVIGSGGGLLNQGVLASPALQPSSALRNSTVSHNFAGANGGGVANYGGTLELFQSTLSSNTAAIGGGGYFGPLDQRAEQSVTEGGGSSFTIIQSSTITQNEAGSGGGGIAIQALHAAGSQINSTIIAENTDLSFQAPDVFEFTAGGPTIANNTAFSLIGVADGSFFIPGNPSTNGNLVGTFNNPIDPLLSGLVSTGPTTVHVPLVGSPAIDQADPSITGGFDQLGNPRVQNGRADMGAVEIIPPTCDLDGDADCDCDDINLLTAEVATGGNGLNFDLDGDAEVDLDDVTQWLALAGARPENFAATGGNPFLPGDANLDGTVDGQDFLIWNMNKFSGSNAWCDGDFNADGNVNGQDFLIWNAHKFTSSDEAAKMTPPLFVFAVPPEDHRDGGTDRVSRAVDAWFAHMSPVR